MTPDDLALLIFGGYVAVIGLLIDVKMSQARLEERVQLLPCKEKTVCKGEHKNAHSTI